MLTYADVCRFQETQEAHRQFQLAAELDPLNVKLLCKYGAFLEELPDTDAQVYVTYADVC